MVRGASLFIGGYPNEFTLINEIKAGSVEVLHWPFYLYLLSIAVLTIIGIFIQSKLRKGHQPDGHLDTYYKRV
jgi:hypothetical protein